MKLFASAKEAMPSREAKLAINKPHAAPAPNPAAGQDRVPSYTGNLRPDLVQQQRTAGGAGDTGSRQGEVWSEVAKTQMKLAAGLTTASVAAMESRSSLQLSLENEKLKAARNGYLAALQDKAKAEGDVIGFVFAIDGKPNSGDVYPSNGLFQKMWPKLLNAAITEAIGERAGRDGRVDAPPVSTIAGFLAAAEAGKSQAQAVGKLMRKEIRDADAALYVEAKRYDGGFVHRNYLAK